MNLPSYEFMLEPSVKNSGSYHSWELLTKNISINSNVLNTQQFNFSSLSESDKISIFEVQLELIGNIPLVTDSKTVISLNINDLLADYILTDKYVFDFLLKSKNIALEMNEYFHEFKTNKSMKTTEELSKLCPVWLDDYGSGYTSLNTLKSFNFDCVKVDKDFFWKNDSTHSFISLYNSICTYCDEVIIEGIESIRQKELIFSKEGILGQGRLWEEEYIKIKIQ